MKKLLNFLGVAACGLVGGMALATILLLAIVAGMLVGLAVRDAVMFIYGLL